MKKSAASIRLRDSADQRALIRPSLKPVGDRCNLRCRYCYEGLRVTIPSSTSVMSLATLSTVIEAILHPESDVEEVYMHGGEPLLAGKEFFRRAIDLIRSSARGRKIRIGVQTNGVLLDASWVDLFLDGDVRVGISLDGSQSIHDRYRVGRKADSTYDAVVRAIRLLQQNQLEFGVISVFTAETAEDPDNAHAILETMVDLGVKHLDIHPSYSPKEVSGAMSAHNVNAKQYSSFMSAAFDKWLSIPKTSLRIRSFEDIFSAFSGVGSDVCHRSGQCMSIVGVDPDGTVAPCTRPFAENNVFGVLSAQIPSSRFHETLPCRPSKAPSIRDACLRVRANGALFVGMAVARTSGLI